jgi:hypothetical protein
MDTGAESAEIEELEDELGGLVKTQVGRLNEDWNE